MKHIYEVHIDASAMRHLLADIEQGDPLRMFKARTFADAWALVNAARFTAGMPMLPKPRPPTWPGTVDASGGLLVIKIVRRG